VSGRKGRKHGKEVCDLLIMNIRQLLTIPSTEGPLSNPDRKSLGIVENGFVGIIKEVGEGKPLMRARRSVDAKNNIVLPGFIDAHTHMIFAGSREREFSMRVGGRDYLEIMKEGGGIQSTVQSTRKASREELFTESYRRLNDILSWGTTTCEVKSGYGLTTSDEIKMLDVARKLGNEHPVDVIPTFLGAHDVPVEYRNEKEDYIDLLTNEMIPRVSEGNYARFCDVFCEEGVFNKEETERILSAGNAHGLKAKIHVDEFVNIGGCELAESVHAVSCDHLLKTDEKGIESMKSAGTIAVLLPGSNLFLMEEEKPPIQMMRKKGLPIAIASDFNPGSSPILSMPVIISLSCLLYGLTPEEAIVGATVNAAYALEEEGRIGSIEKGKKADIVVMRYSNYEEIPYWFAQKRVECIIKGGEIVVGKGGRLN
jgi:imidazolonepropionase